MRSVRLESFVTTARAFADWCVSPPGDEVHEARTTLALLTKLYSLALTLRSPEDMDYELDGTEADDELCRQVYTRAGALPFNYYASFSRPQVVPPEAMETGDLAEDIEDIFRDLSAGLSLYDDGHAPEAEWEFLHSFRSHWGMHASSAVYALHCWLTRTGNWE